MQHTINPFAASGWRLAAVGAAMWLGLHGSAQAGRSCTDKPLTTTALTQGLALATRTMEALNASGAQVVVLARAGQDLSRWGQRWSHLGLAYRSADASGQPVWRVVHKLNRCGTAHADVYRQGLGEFFLDDPWRWEAAYAVLTPDLQARLLPLLADNARASAMHHRPYSLVSFAWGQRYQQSNQWLIETLAATDPMVSHRASAQRWLMAQGYRPASLHIGPLTRLGARVSAANVAFDDHPDGQRFADRIDTVTADSVLQWLAGSRLGSAPFVLRL
jgi:hypothetical protein